MRTIRRFEDLEVWRAARALTRKVYAVSGTGPFASDFALRNQIRRAAISIMSNIAEGFESRTRALFIDLLGRAKGSAGELRAQLYVALDAEYISPDQRAELSALAESCSSQISGFTAYLRESPQKYVRDDVPPYGAE